MTRNWPTCSRDSATGWSAHKKMPFQDDKATISIADVFCGAGGLTYGVGEAVRELGKVPRHVLAMDSDPVALDVYRRNFDPHISLTDNVWTSVTTRYKVNADGKAEFLRGDGVQILSPELHGAKGRVDVLLGAPPCEGHSTSNNNTRHTDPRNMYYVSMPFLAVALDAPVVVIENVIGIRRDRLNVFRHTIDLFHQADYATSEHVIDATSLGLPQTRRRHILVASRHRKPDIEGVVKSIDWKPRTLEETIGDLRDSYSDDLMDRPGDLSSENRKRIDFLFDRGEYDLRNEMRPLSHKNGHTYPSIYGRLSWDKPAGTITTGFNTPGRGRYIHPDRRRTLTPHEAARIQGFPDGFEFRMVDGSPLTRQSLANIIGNAVPPPIGRAAGHAALATLMARPEESGEHS